MTDMLSPNFGDGRSNGAGYGLTASRLGDDLDPVGMSHRERSLALWPSRRRQLSARPRPVRRPLRARSHSTDNLSHLEICSNGSDRSPCRQQHQPLSPGAASRTASCGHRRAGLAQPETGRPCRAWRHWRRWNGPCWSWWRCPLQSSQLENLAICLCLFPRAPALLRLWMQFRATPPISTLAFRGQKFSKLETFAYLRLQQQSRCRRAIRGRLSKSNFPTRGNCFLITIS